MDLGGLTWATGFRSKG